MKRHQWIILATLVLGVASLFVEQSEQVAQTLGPFAAIIDYVLVGTILLEIAYGVALAKYRLIYVRQNVLSLLFAAGFLSLFVFNKVSAGTRFAAGTISVLVVVLRNLFLVLKVFGRINKLSRYIERLTVHPAQTIVFSFFGVIMVGALVLMMNFTTVDGNGLRFVDALFTATSAVCVTGLIVVDTATRFTVAGHIVIVALIQVGGLGIMMLSYFGIFLLRRRVTVEDRVLLSYMLSEDNMSGLSKALFSILKTTMVVELAGAVLLTVGFVSSGMSIGRSVFHGLFHSVSAFCNAGFALFSDSLEGFRLHPLVMGTIGGLIVLGGLGFGVILNLWQLVGAHAARLRGRRSGRLPALTLNTRVVLRLTLLLLVGGTLLIYALEHGNAMASYGLAEQYGAALFQAVTLRTAGFNSIPFGGLRDATYLLMILFMFIGGASGSTAGGIKINTVGVLGAYVASVLRDEEETRIGHFVITPEKVARAFLVLLTAISAAGAGAFLLALTESGPFLHLLFETVSALGTVGLSTGVTGSLTVGGKLIIVVLMFVGRLGALTLLTALRRRRKATGVAFPSGDIAIG